MEITSTFQIESQKKQVDSLSEEEVTKLANQNLELIVLKGNSYSTAFFTQLAGAIKDTNKLQRLNINDVFVGRGKDEIPQSIEVLFTSLIGKQITRIDISNNAVNPYGANAMKPFLSQASSLKVLLINNCGLGIQGVTHIAEGLAAGAPNLEVLAIARNRAEDQGAQAISKALVNLKSLQELHIYQNGIKEAGMIPLLEQLGANCLNLQVVDIRDNFVHSNTSKTLAALIVGVKTLHSLNISDCNIAKASNEPILEAIEQSQLNFVKLGYNYAELSDAQGNRLADYLKDHLQNLEQLDVKGNEFKGATKRKFRQILQEANKSRALTVFDSDEEMDQDAVDELAREFSVLQI